MKLHYLGIIRNEGKPSHELVSEKELSSYSRFTKNNYASSPRRWQKGRSPVNDRTSKNKTYTDGFSRSGSRLFEDSKLPCGATTITQRMRYLHPGTHRRPRNRKRMQEPSLGSLLGGVRFSLDHCVPEEDSGVGGIRFFGRGQYPVAIRHLPGATTCHRAASTKFQPYHPGCHEEHKTDETLDLTFHAYARSEGVCGIIISDHAYPALVAHQLLSKIIDEFLEANPRSSWVTGQPKIVMPQLKEYIDKYQDPHQADNILKIQKELDETKIVLHKTIESVLQRGEKIDDLVQKSDGLSSQSKMFYQQAKKQNSCCLVM
ncbi:hypothetical protein N8I77_000429 [Diaporthe amygdali]|uniref:Synaptobrevin homolog YKT6 n=1 Tax=Phomopsis amygdali TaxID=1214568 RepID=A0AAD9W9S8_PHOAM|nr:hypothetical protein N8I77_000429 [Diaporthe amygdali]